MNVLTETLKINLRAPSPDESIRNHLNQKIAVYSDIYPYTVGFIYTANYFVIVLI